MRVAGRIPRQALSLVAIPLLAVLPVPGEPHATDQAKRHNKRDQARFILRLSDLPRGYANLPQEEGEEEDEVFCKSLSLPPDTPPKMARFVKRFHPRGCAATYLRAYTVPGQPEGPLLVGTATLTMKSGKAANAAWGVVPELLGRLMNDHRPHQLDAVRRVGSATRLFHARSPLRIYPVLILGPAGRQAAGRISIAVWRSGNTVAAVMAGSDSFAASDRAALELARRQQFHIREPTRYKRSERFDGELWLDDPSLALPVYWLGRNFRPGRGLPSNRLFDAYAPSAEEPDEELPGVVLQVRYRNIRLYTWTAETWPQYRNTRGGRAIVAWRCTKVRRIELPGGSAVIYAGYKKNHRRCPKEPPRAFTARVQLGDFVIAVNAIHNDELAPDGNDFPFPAPTFPLFIETANPYGSFKGMEAIVRGLALRSPPAY